MAAMMTASAMVPKMVPTATPIFMSGDIPAAPAEALTLVIPDCFSPTVPMVTVVVFKLTVSNAAATWVEEREEVAEDVVECAAVVLELEEDESDGLDAEPDAVDDADFEEDVVVVVGAVDFSPAGVATGQDHPFT